MSEPIAEWPGSVADALGELVAQSRAHGVPDADFRAAVEAALTPVEPLARYTVVSAGGRLFIRARANNDHPHPWLSGTEFHPWSAVCEHGTPEVVAVPAAAISVAERAAEAELARERTYVTAAREVAVELFDAIMANGALDVPRISETRITDLHGTIRRWRKS